MSPGGQKTNLACCIEYKGQVIVHTVDGRTQMLWLGPTTGIVPSGSVHIKAPHSFRTIGCEKQRFSIRCNKRSDLISPCIDIASQWTQLAPTSVFLHLTFKKVKPTNALSGFDACDQPALVWKESHLSLGWDVFVNVQWLCGSPSSFPALGHFELMVPSIAVHHNQFVAKRIGAYHMGMVAQTNIQQFRLSPIPGCQTPHLVNVVVMLSGVGVNPAMVGTVAACTVGGKEQQLAIRRHDGMGFLRLAVHWQWKDKARGFVVEGSGGKTDIVQDAGSPIQTRMFVSYYRQITVHRRLSCLKPLQAVLRLCQPKPSFHGWQFLIGVEWVVAKGQ